MQCRSTTFVALVFTLAAGSLGAQGIPAYDQKTPLDPANLDRTANACVDFYQFANGG